MPSSPLERKCGRTTLGVACIIAFKKHTRSKDVGCGMPSSPLGSTHGWTTSGVACHHRVWAAHTVEQHRAWHAIITFGKHKRLNDVGRGMTSPPLDYTHGRITSGVTCYHLLLESKHGRMTSGMTCHHCLWTAHKVGLGWQRQAWHDITPDVV